MGTLLLSPRDCFVPPHPRHSRHPASMTHPSVNVPHRDLLHPLCWNSPDSQPAGLRPDTSPFQHLQHGHSRSHRFLEERENRCVPPNRRTRHTAREVSVIATKQGLTILQSTTVTDAPSERVGCASPSYRPSQKHRRGLCNVNNEKHVDGTRTKKKIDITRSPCARAASANKAKSPGFLRRTSTEPHIERGLLEGAGMARLACRSEMFIDHSLSPNAKAAKEHGEKWAGPAYVNSPPPNSLPLPRFSQKHGINVPTSMSCVKDSSVEVQWDSATATWELRRMLNLEVSS